MTRCRLCGREATDLVHRPDLAQDAPEGLWFCPEVWPCLIRADGLNRRLMGVLW